MQIMQTHQTNNDMEIKEILTIKEVWYDEFSFFLIKIENKIINKYTILNYIGKRN